jgi:hypothetical protein
MPDSVTRLAITCIGLLTLLACDSPTDTSRSHADTTTITSLRMIAPPELIVNQQALFAVLGQTSSGERGLDLSRVAWTSSDSSIAQVSGLGVVTALRRGSATIGASMGDMGVSAAVSVKARLKIARVMLAKLPPQPIDVVAVIAIGDTIQLAAVLVDINGYRLDDVSVTSWSSNMPDVVSVTETGLMVGKQHMPNSEFRWPNCTACVTITAQTAEGPATTPVFVEDVLAGQSATIRFAHTANNLGPVTFVPSQGEPFTARFGESLERRIASGTVHVYVDGIPGIVDPQDGYANFDRVIAPGDYVSLYVVGVVGWGMMTALWTEPDPVPADSGWFRFVSASPYATVIYVRPPDGAMTGPPDECYFDMGGATPYYRRPASSFDLILAEKGGRSELARFRLAAVPGTKVSYVILGQYPDSAPRIMRFDDP